MVQLGWTLKLKTLLVEETSYQSPYNVCSIHMWVQNREICRDRKLSCCLSWERGRRGEEGGSRGFLFEMLKCSKIVKMVVHICAWIKNWKIIHFKGVNCTVCEFYLNKSDFQKNIDCNSYAAPDLPFGSPSDIICWDFGCSGYRKAFLYSRSSSRYLLLEGPIIKQ